MFIKYSFFRTILSPKALFHATKNLAVYNKVIIILLLSMIVGVFVWWVMSIYNFTTVVKPDRGGKYIEAYVGQPRYINPLLAHSSSADMNLSKLIFSGLFKYDENGIITEDIADRFEMSEDGKEYTIFMKDNVFWHDGEKLNTDDIIYTINVAKDIAYGAAGVSNEMRLIWDDVDIEKIDDNTIKFKLKEPDNNFLQDLILGILPKHIWEDIKPEQFQLSEYNQKPIGSGPYKFVDFDINENENLINSYTIRSDKEYYLGEPFITKIITNFYPTRSDAVLAYQNGEVSGVVVDKKEYVNSLAESAHKKSIELPHYFAVFLNQTKSVPLAFDEVREAISLATDKGSIAKEVFGEDVVTKDSPFSEGVVGFDDEIQYTGFNIESANKLLDEKGWEKKDDGVRMKDNARLAFSLHINENYEAIVQIAEILKAQWKEIGVEVDIKRHEKSDMEANVIKPRDYDAIIDAHQMNFEPNLKPMWHSSEKDDPGLNYALLDNESMDKSLENAIITNNNDERMSYYKSQQEIFRDEIPAIFLLYPKLSFMHSGKIKGIEINRANSSVDRYANINKWYIKEKRELKK